MKTYTWHCICLPAHSYVASGTFRFAGVVEFRSRRNSCLSCAVVGVSARFCCDAFCGGCRCHKTVDALDIDRHLVTALSSQCRCRVSNVLITYLLCLITEFQSNCLVTQPSDPGHLAFDFGSNPNLVSFAVSGLEDGHLSLLLTIVCGLYFSIFFALGAIPFFT